MTQMTDDFYAEIKKSHTAVSYVEIISNDGEVIKLPLTDGWVDVDRTAQIRRHLTATAVDPEGKLTPRETGEVLTPYGTEMIAWRGVRYQGGERDGEEELAPLGVFRLSAATITAGIQGTVSISLEGYDHSRTVSRDKFLVPYTIDAGTNILDAIKAIIARTFPDAVYDVAGTTISTTGPYLFEAGGDPWDAATTLAQSIGCELYFDVLGRVVVAPPPDISALPAPDFSYVENEGCSMIDLTRIFTDEPGYNGVIVVGESTGDELPPVRGEAWDMNSTSPTYRYGPYGEVPMFINDSTVKTVEDCQIMAAAQLSMIIGYTSQLTLTTIVNPSYEGGDVIQVKRKLSGIDGLYIADAFNVPLMTGITSTGGTATQSLYLRERRPMS